MNEITYVTHNKGKIESAKQALKEVNFKIFEYDLDEPRSDSVEEISKAKVMQAYELVKTPCISMDSGFCIDKLNGFPNTFVNHALSTIGIEGILKLMEDNENRNCKFTECLSYYDGVNLHQFSGLHLGKLSRDILGNDTDKKWSDLWYIFIPEKYEKTLAQMTDEERDERLITRGNESISSFDVFAKWYKENKI